MNRCGDLTKDRDARYVEVRLEDLALERGGRVILENVGWSIQPGQRWVLAGGNGAGKTQLLKIIAGAVWPTPRDDSQGPVRRREPVAPLCVA